MRFFTLWRLIKSVASLPLCGVWHALTLCQWASMNLPTYICVFVCVCWCVHCTVINYVWLCTRLIALHRPQSKQRGGSGRPEAAAEAEADVQCANGVSCALCRANPLLPPPTVCHHLLRRVLCLVTQLGPLISICSETERGREI